MPEIESTLGHGEFLKKLSVSLLNLQRNKYMLLYETMNERPETHQEFDYLADAHLNRAYRAAIRYEQRITAVDKTLKQYIYICVSTLPNISVGHVFTSLL